MTTTDLLAALGRECPNGVSFESMAMRLLRQKVPFQDGQIVALKAAMFQLGNGLWFSREMISDDKSLLALQEQATRWLTEHACFSVERLFINFGGVFRHITTPDDRAAFLTYLGFTVAEWGNAGYFCSQPQLSLDNSLAAVAETIAEWLEEVEGTLTFHEIEQEMQHLTDDALESIRRNFLPEVHEIDLGVVPCWRSADAISLPEDFSEKLTTIVDTLIALDEKVSATNLEFALNLFYRIRLREEYALLNNDTFMRVCAKHYQGVSDVFLNTKRFRVRANDLSVPGRRVRSPNTRFCDLGVPIGAELVFTKDNKITCTVLDDSNQVEYDGKAWSISALAIYLLNVSSTNGFYYFSYEGEILWNRRLRLKSKDKHDDQATEMLPPIDLQETDDGIGLEGRALSPSTWRAFRSAGTNPRVAEWVRRVADGESMENIASESNVKVSTVKEYIRRYHCFVFCKENFSVPEVDADV